MRGAGRKEKEGRGVIVLGKGSYLSVLETFKNLAPILDAVLVDNGTAQVSLTLILSFGVDIYIP
jgi:hypothetical protein